MPGTPHEVLIEALRKQPSLLHALVERLTGVRLPRGLKPSDSTARFVKVAELRMDLILRSGRRGWTIVEVQRGVDPRKGRRWPLVASVLFDQTRTLGDLIVITARRAVARWAERVACVRTRLGTELRLKPVVLYLGDDAGKALLDPRRPELAFFAAWAMQHRHGPKARELVGWAFELADRLPRALRTRSEMRLLQRSATACSHS